MPRKQIQFSQEGLAKDITPGFEKPLWPFSSFGPAKFESTIIAGLDISPEELRFKALEALRSGNPVEYVCTHLNFGRECTAKYNDL